MKWEVGGVRVREVGGGRCEGAWGVSKKNMLRV